MKTKAQITTLQITFVTALAGLLFGYDTGVIGVSQLYFTEYFNFTAAEQGWAVAVPCTAVWWALWPAVIWPIASVENTP